jgi:Tfp pilus assembly protein PilF/1,2-phenylacetyl-CoA epoxidase PaaB subunit
MHLVGFALAIVLLAPAAAIAQHEQHAATGKLGTVNFETSCRPATHADFNRAMALLHSFEFGPAIDSFNKVLSADPDCAIAYWGIALSHWSNPFGGIKSGPLLERGLAAAQKGLATGTGSPREKAYLNAVSQLYRDASTIAHRDRTLAYAKAMEGVQRDYRDDIEARIFYALALDQTALPSDKTYALQAQAAEILEPLWKKFPDHPGLAHYIIHTYDVPALAPKALTAARRYAVIAPSSPHALHMPSHTFTRVGAWQDSVEANIKSEQESMRQSVIGEALHAMDYQTYAYLQMAQDKKAMALLDRVAAAAARLNTPGVVQGAAPPMAGPYARNAVAARYALERGAWAEAAALQPVASPFPNADAIIHFARAIGAARSGRPAAAAPDIEKLAVLRDALKAAKDEYWAEQVDIARQGAVAWVTFADGNKTEALRLMSAAADQEDRTDKAAVSPGPIAPARELLGEMLLEAGDAKQAAVAFEATMKKEPNRFRGAYGAARAAEAAGNRAAAGKYYLQVVALAKDADTDRPELVRARSFRN